MKKHSLIAILLGVLVLPLVISCTKPDDGGSGNSNDPDTPITPIDPINPINPVDPNTPNEIWGVYNPGKKIKKMYKSSTYQEKYLSEVWNWDGDLLESIDHYTSEGVFYDRKKFTYENHRLHRIETIFSVSGVETVEEYRVFDYENLQLKRINFYNHQDLLHGCITFAYENGKLSKMECNDGHRMDNRTFIWEGNNVVKMVHTTGYDDTIIACLEYDNKVNVLKGFLDCEIKDGIWGRGYKNTTNSMSLFDYGWYLDFCVSNNNVVKVHWSDDSEVDFAAYQYDSDGYPIRFSTEGISIFYEYE